MMNTTETPHVMHFTDERLTKIRTGSLIGMLLTETKGQLPKRIVLTFPASTLRFLFTNFTEFNVPCLLSDVLTLVAQGVTVEVKYSN